MVKIRQLESDSKLPILVLEGKLFGTGCGDLQKICQQYLGEGKEIMLDLGNVRFFDIHGIKVLHELTRKRVQLLNCPFYVSKMMEKLIPIKTTKKVESL